MFSVNPAWRKWKNSPSSPISPFISPAVPPLLLPRKQRYVKPEEQIRHLKRVRNWLCGLLIASLLAFAASATLVVYLLTQQDTPGIGQNYDTIDTTDGT